jgi:hypothetical protein
MILATLPTSNTFQDDLRCVQLDRVDAAVKRCWILAAQSPHTFYSAMQRYVHFNAIAGSLVARLASSIGLSRELFISSETVVRDEADRSMLIAAKVLAATLDEHCDAKYQVPHRTLAQATLKAVGDYAKLTAEQRNQFGITPDWLAQIMTQFTAGYQGVPGNLIALVQSLGFHVASEMLADREYQILDTVLRYDLRNQGWDAYSKIVPTVSFQGNTLSSWYWVRIHGEHESTGVEFEHCQNALEALALIEEFRPEPAPQIRAWALEGFQTFAALQQKLFAQIIQESLLAGSSDSTGDYKRSEIELAKMAA